MMAVRIIVGDESEVSFFDAADADAGLTLIEKIDNPAARQPDRDLESDRPGRAYNSTTGARSAVDGERSTRRSSHEDFARLIAEEVERGRNAHEFERLVLIAGPRMLGLIRAALSAPARQLVAAEVSKDLVHADEQAIRKHVPRAAFHGSGAR
jgi:protein required for attachment to host cells